MNDAFLGDRLGFTVEEVRPSRKWLRGYRQALDLDIYVRRQPDDYRRDFALELETAAAVLAAVAETEEAARFEYVDLEVVNRYGPIPPRGKPLVGVIAVRLLQSTFLKLRERNASPSEYAHNWIFLSGFKDQPDSRDLLNLH